MDLVFQLDFLALQRRAGAGLQESPTGRLLALLLSMQFVFMAACAVEPGPGSWQGHSLGSSGFQITQQQKTHSLNNSTLETIIYKLSSRLIT